MKVSREQMAANRERILEAAGRLFRERGFDNVGVADVMREAGMTHGAFYGHFASKEALAAEAAAQALEKTTARWNEILDSTGERGLREIVDSYLSPKHRDAPGGGCAIASLGAEVSRQESELRETFAREVAQMLDALAAYMPGKTQELQKEQAMALLAQMVGAIVISRVLGRKGMSEEVLVAARKAVMLPS